MPVSISVPVGLIRMLETLLPCSSKHRSIDGLRASPTAHRQSSALPQPAVERNLRDAVLRQLLAGQGGRHTGA